MHTYAPTLPSARYSAASFAALGFACLAVLLPTAIFISDLPNAAPKPGLIEPVLFFPPKGLPTTPPTATLDVPMPAAAPSPPAVAPPALKALDIRPDPLAIPGTGVVIGGLLNTFGGDAIWDGLDQLDFPPEAIVQIAPRTRIRTQSTLTVVTDLIVERDGSVSSVTILSSDHPELTEAVRAAAAKWRFRPGLKDGQPVKFRMRQRFDFRS